MSRRVRHIAVADPAGQVTTKRTRIRRTPPWQLLAPRHTLIGEKNEKRGRKGSSLDRKTETTQARRDARVYLSSYCISGPLFPISLLRPSTARPPPLASRRAAANPSPTDLSLSSPAHSQGEEMAAAPAAGGQGGGSMDGALLDDIIRRLLEVRTARPGKQVQLSESEIRQLCTVSREIFLNQPNLLELEAPIKICGAYLASSLSRPRPAVAVDLVWSRRQLTSRGSLAIASI